VALAALILAFLLRPIFHGLAMFFYTNPLVWLPPLFIIALGGLALRFLSPGGSSPAASGRATDPRDDPIPISRSPRRRNTLQELRQRGPTGPVAVVLALALFSFLVGAVVNQPLTARSIYKNTQYEQIPGLPPGGSARLVPKDVAVQIASSGFNSPTERLSDFHIVKTQKGLAWTALRTPDGLVRTFTKKSKGLVSLDASSTERNVTSADAEFKTAPGLQVTDNLRWRLLKKHFLISLTEPNAILDARGQPAIVVPYISYKGFLVRRPVLGGVFVVRPNGDIEDLSPEEARARPEIAGSGRLFPDSLARRIQDAYSYKRGIWNRLFTHEEQTQITDTETNQQPYLTDFGARGSKWVTVAEPYGRAFAVNAIFLTDTVSGQTQIWRVPEKQSLSGNRRAIQTVRSVSIPGIVFADDSGAGARARGGGGGGGRFRVVEPRPVFVGGRLVYLVSVIPESANSVSKSVIVDAARNKVVAIFDNDTDPEADRKAIAYLASGELPEGAAQNTGTPPGTEPDAPSGDDDTPTASPPSGGSSAPSRGKRPSPAELERRLDRIVERQRQTLKEAEELREALRAP